MYCSKCGNKIPDGARFCNKCGAALKGAQQEMRPSDDKTDKQMNASLLEELSQTTHDGEQGKEEYKATSGWHSFPTWKKTLIALAFGSAIGLLIGVAQSSFEKQKSSYVIESDSNESQNVQEQEQPPQETKQTAAEAINSPKPTAPVVFTEQESYLRKMYIRMRKDEEGLKKHLNKLVKLVYKNEPKIRENVEAYFRDTGAVKNEAAIYERARIYIDANNLSKLIESYSNAEISDGYFKEAPKFVEDLFKDGYVLIESEEKLNKAKYFIIGRMVSSDEKTITLTAPQLFRMDLSCGEPIMYSMDYRIANIPDDADLEAETITFSLLDWTIKVKQGGNIVNYFIENYPINCSQ